MPKNPETATRRLELKKYPNRRYYDATRSRHLTLDEIRSLIQRGYDIRVTDAKTSADITAQVLAQIILDLETPKIDSFPVPLLMRVIRMNDQLVKDFIEKYFNQALQSFFDYQQQLEDQIRKAHGLPASFPSVSAWTKAVFGPLASAFTPGATSEPAEPPPAPPEPKPAQELRERIQDLQEELAALKQKQRRKRSPARRRKGA